MKQYKTSMLILVGLAFAGMLGVKRYLDTKPAPQPDPGAQVSQQLAVETAPAPAAMPKPQAQPRPQAAAQTPPAAPSSHDKGPEVLSYIQFLALPENYPVLSPEISWREYREYRRAFARGIETA